MVVECGYLGMFTSESRMTHVFDGSRVKNSEKIFVGRGGLTGNLISKFHGVKYQG